MSDSAGDDTALLLEGGLTVDERCAPPALRRRFALLAAGATALVACGALARGAGAAEPTQDGAVLLHRVASLVEVGCQVLSETDPCYFSCHWAKTQGIFQHPEWYKGLIPESSLEEFQYALHKAGAPNCTQSKPCNAGPLAKKIEARVQAAAKAAAEQAAQPTPPPGPRAQTFYMYRAQSKASYPLENINTADLAGVFWYLHQEVVVATPRKYSIDRIKRYKVTVKNTWEFWNAHKRQFSAFVAYDAGGCTTPVCKDIYHQYGFVVGCQVQPLSVASYLGRHQTNWQCVAGEDKCRAPIWYSLPGPCPAKGIPNGEIDPDSTNVQVNKYKTPECTQRMPGGLCKAGQEPTGAPDCTYSYEDAGEVLLDELVGIEDYDAFWKTSFTECARKRSEGELPEDTVCRHNKEYDPDTDAGVGTDFWNGKHDKEKCAERMDKARALFKQKYPQFPEHLDEPPCEFDMYYEHEFDWKINHTGSPNSPWWRQRM